VGAAVNLWHARARYVGDERGVIPVIVVLVGSLLVGGYALTGGDPLGKFFEILGGMVEGLAQLAGHIVDTLPDAEDLNIEVAEGWIVGYNMLNGFLPLGEALLYAGILLSAILLHFGWRIAVIVWHLIPKPLSGT
jgi:hypothetical protein